MSNSEKTVILLIVDAIILYIALALSLLPIEQNAHYGVHFQGFSYLLGIWILMYFTEGLYTLRTHNPAELPISLIRATSVAAVVSIGVMYFLPEVYQEVLPGTRLLVIALLVPYMMFEWRHFFFSFLSSGSRLRNTLLIGSQETLDIANEEIQKKPYLGYKIMASVTPTEAEELEIPKDIQFVAIERNTISDQQLYKKVFSLLGSGVEVVDLANFTEKISGKIPLASIDQAWFIEYCGQQDSISHDLLKAFIDRSIALILLILLIPVAIILFPILLIVHGRPIFFTQNRVGLNNKTFTLYKLRSMVVDAEKDGAQWAKPKDARITPLGHVLRKTRLDELPQLINIFRGEMSLVGPRPERPEIIEKSLAPNIPFFGLRHLVKPGVTGWAQVTFRYGFSQEDSKEKLQFDLFYVKNRSVWLDMLVIIKTIKTVITGAGQ